MVFPVNSSAILFPKKLYEDSKIRWELGISLENRCAKSKAAKVNITGCLPDENVIIMGRKDVLKFLGPCAEVYMAARAAVDNQAVITTIPWWIQIILSFQW
jgi:hypothetical protein